MRTRKRILSLLLCGALLFSLCSPSAFAKAQTAQDSGQAAAAGGLCEHHTEHDSECGYTEGEPGTPCTHEHTPECYTEVTKCVHEHNEDCYPKTEDSISDNTATPADAEEREPVNCAHVCSKESGCITEVKDCKHEHDSECGYSPATEGTPCGFVCEKCSEETSTPPNAEIVTVASVQAMINALPEEVTEDNAEDVKAWLEAIDKAKAELSDEELDGLDFSRYMEAAAALEQLLYSLYPQTAVLAEASAEDSTQFATVDELKAFNTNDNDGTKNPAKVYFGDNNQQWWIAGSQNDNSMILFAASPLATGLQFEPTCKNKTYDLAWGCDYTSIKWPEPTEVYPNHYGASPLRDTLKRLETSYFTTAEQDLMKDTTIYTNDRKNKSVYSTTDKLYLAYGVFFKSSDPNDMKYLQYITVGTNSSENKVLSLHNGLHVDRVYWESGKDNYIWLRAPYNADGFFSSELVVAASPGLNSGITFGAGIDDPYEQGALVPAFELNLSSVSFVSAAPAASKDGSLEIKTVNDKALEGAFTLRYKTNTLGSAVVSYDNSKVTLTDVPSGTYFVVQNSAGAVAKQITKETEVSASDMGLDSFANCKVWLEKTDTSANMTYATLARPQMCSVTITAGTGLEITSDNGTQEVLPNTTISEIIVEAANGYYLPDDYINNFQSQLKGLQAAKTNNGFTISGTPAGDVDIVLPAAAPKSYTVTLDANGGTIASEEDVTGYTYGVGAMLPTNVTKDGYKFEGWHESSALSDNPVTEISKTDTGNKTYYAKWLSTNAGVTAVSIKGTPGTINGTTISVVLPFGTTPPTNNSEINITPADGATVSGPATADNGETWTFTVTAEDGQTKADYTINVSVAKNPAAGNIADIAAVKSTIQSKIWTVGQSTANTEAAVKSWIEQQLAGMELNGVTCTVSVKSITPATAGNAANTSGVNGSFTFDVTLYKGANDTLATDTVTGKTGTITATPYQAKNYTISVSASPAEGGKVSGGGTYAENASVTVTAFPNSGYKFVKWTEGGTEVSKDTSYNFTITGNRTLVAVFEKDSGTTPPQPMEYSVTFDGNGGTSPAAQTTKGGKLTSLPTSTQSGYSFNGWYTAKTGGDKITLDTIFTASMTVYAQWTQNSSGGGGGSSSGDNDSSGGGSTIIDRPTEKHPDIPTTGQTKPAKPDKNGNATVDNGAVQSAINAAKDDAKKNGNPQNGVAVVIPVTPKKDQTSFSVTIKAQTLDALVRENVKRLEIHIEGVIVEGMDTELLKWLDSVSANGDIILRVKQIAPASLSKEAQAAIGTRPVYDLSLVYLSGSKEVPVTDLKGHAITVRLPYTPAKEEQTGNLYAVYVDGKGKVEWLTKSSYDADQKAVVFEATHFSTYGVGYKNPVPAFTDIKNHWAADNIIFVASRGLLTGTGNDQFSPDTGMTRGMFVTALGRLAGIDPANYKTGKFTDVKADAYYAPYVNWAAEKGIVNGTAATTFSPDTNVTREQMAVIMANYAKKLGYDLPVTHEAVTFADNAQISGWAAKEVKAMQQVGILAGKNGNRFDPKGTATHAEVATVLRRFVEIVIDPQTAQGWVQNHSGFWQYIKNGKPATGWLYDDKKWYWLDNNGWMFGGGWKQIGDKWYYFYSDGSMAVNTTIDGYTIGPDGARK